MKITANVRIRVSLLIGNDFIKNVLGQMASAWRRKVTPGVIFGPTGNFTEHM